MIKKNIILLFPIIFMINSYAQQGCTQKHIYGFGSDFYYLDIFPDFKYKLKIGMYLDQYVKGSYNIHGDTLELKSFQFQKTKYSLDYFDSLKVIKGLSKFLIVDSVLIPIFYRRLLPFSLSMLRDTTISKEYLQTDFHAHYKLTFWPDSTFKYSTGIKYNHIKKGKWRQVYNEITLDPEDNENNYFLQWICTNNKFVIVENYLIGQTFDNDNNICEYHYLIGLSPRKNNDIKR